MFVETKYWIITFFLTLTLSNTVFILLINVKMPTNADSLIFISRINLMLH